MTFTQSYKQKLVDSGTNYTDREIDQLTMMALEAILEVLDAPKAIPVQNTPAN